MKLLKIYEILLLIIFFGMFQVACNKIDESLVLGKYKGELLLEHETLSSNLPEIIIQISGDDLYANYKKIGIMALVKGNVAELFNDCYSYDEAEYNNEAYKLYKELIKLEEYWCVGAVSFQYYIFEVDDNLYFA